MLCNCTKCNGENTVGETPETTSKQRVDSWFGLEVACPRSPLDIIAYAKFDAVVGEFMNSNTFINPPAGTWTVDTTTITTEPTCEALETTNQLMVENAKHWKFSRKTANLDSLLAPTLHNLVFLRGGTQWKMRIPLDTKAAQDIQLTLRNNAGTRGDSQGTIPVINFSGPFSLGAHTLEVTLRSFGHVFMALRFNLDGSNYSMYAMEWIIEG